MNSNIPYLFTSMHLLHFAISSETKISSYVIFVNTYNNFPIIARCFITEAQFSKAKGENVLIGIVYLFNRNDKRHTQ